MKPIFAWFAAIVALFADLAGGVAINSTAPEGMGLFSSAGHRMTGSLAALLLVALSVLFLATEKRPGMGRLGWLLLGTVVLVGVCGEVFATGSLAGLVHAILAPVVFALAVAIAWVSSARWSREPVYVQDKGWPSLLGLGRNSVALLLIQVALGAAFRHEMMGVMAHILVAMVVVIFLLTLVVLITMLPSHPSLKPAAIMLAVILFVQVFLGLTVVSIGSGKSASLAIAGIGAAHVALGAVTLAAMVVLGLEIRRCVRKADTLP